MENKLTLTQYVQDCYVYHCMIDTDFLKSARANVNFNIFDSFVVRQMVKICYDFYDTYKKAPYTAITDIMLDKKRTIKESEYNLLKVYLKALVEKTFNEEDKKYLLNRLEKELIDVRLTDKIPLARKLILEGKSDDGRQLLLSCFHPVLPSDVGGVDYLVNFEEAVRRNFEQDFLMSTGIEHLDSLIGGFRRQNFICMFGAYKTGKTWYLQHMAKTAVILGLNVYHASFEVPREEMEIRYDMMFGGLVNKGKAQEVEVARMGQDRKPVFTKILAESVYNPDVVRTVRGIMAGFGGKLIIEKFPPGRAGASAIDIENRIIMYEQAHGIKFNLVICDYADIMKPIGYSVADDIRHQVNQTYLVLKMIADEYNCLVLTVSQVNRPALEKETVRMSALAEDIRKAGNVDGLIAMCATPQQRLAHFRRLLIAGGRSFRDGVGCGIYDNLEIGEFCSWSVPSNFEGVKE